jgi:hypothetical protein
MPPTCAPGHRFVTAHLTINTVAHLNSLRRHKNLEGPELVTTFDPSSALPGAASLDAATGRF